MAKLPGYDSKQGITTERSVQLRDLSREGQFGRDIQTVGKTAQDVAKVWQDAKDFSETLRDKNRMDTGVAEVLSEVDADPAHDNPDVYRKKLEDLKAGIGQFSNNEAAAKFKQYADSAVNQARIKVDGKYRAKMLDFTNANIIEQDAINKKLFVAGDKDANGNDPREVQRGIINAALIKGITDNETTAKRLVKLDEWDTERQDTLLQEVLNESPEAAEKAVTQGTFGKMTTEDKASWLKIIESAKKQRQAEVDRGYKDATEAKDDSFTEQFFNDNLRIADLNAGLKEDETTGGPTRETLLKMRDKLYTAQKERLDTLLKQNPKARDFIKVTDQVIDKKVDLIRAREILIDAYGDGVLSKEEGQMLNKIKKTLKDIKFNKSTDIISLSIKKIKDAFKAGNKSSDDLAADLREYLYGITEEGADPKAVVNGIIERRHKNNYPEYQDWEVGKSYESIIGTVRKLGIDVDGMPLVEKLDAK